MVVILDAAVNIQGLLCTHVMLAAHFPQTSTWEEQGIRASDANEAVQVECFTGRRRDNVRVSGGGSHRYGSQPVRSIFVSGRVQLPHAQG